MLRLTCAVALVLAACGTSAAPDDSAAETAAPDFGGKADAPAPSYGGLYHIAKTTWYANDITDLQLRDDWTYVRARCYYASCAEQIAQTDKFDFVTTSGHQYVRFWSERLAADLTPTPVIDDVYEIRSAATGIQLRKTYTSRWFTLAAVTEDSQCTATGGAWNGTTCTCPDSTYSDSGYGAYVPGAGGCIWAPSGSETACDDSHGSYTDDDETAIATYCVCGVGRFVDTDGSCTAI